MTIRSRSSAYARSASSSRGGLACPAARDACVVIRERGNELQRTRLIYESSITSLPVARPRAKTYRPSGGCLKTAARVPILASSMSSTAPVGSAEDTAARMAAGDAEQARGIVAELARHTPMLSSRSLSEHCGATHPAQGREPAADRLVQAPRRDRTSSLGSTSRPGWSPAARATTVSRSPTPPAPAAFPARCSCPREAPVAKVAAVEAFGGTVTLRRRVGRRLRGGGEATAQRRPARCSCTRSTIPT